MDNKLNRGGYSESINMLRFPLSILVVFVHSYGPDIDVAQLHANGFTGAAFYDYVRIFFSVVIARSAVPIFFIISGYLLFYKVEEYSKPVYLSKLKKRFYSLVVPYFSWNVFNILWMLLFMVAGILIHGRSWTIIFDYLKENANPNILWDCSIWGERETWLGVKTHNSGPILLPFWYMRDLIVMALLSPIIYWLIKRTKLAIILLLFIIYTFDIRVSWISGTFTCAGLFFSLGAYFSIMKQDFTDVLWKWRKIICPLALVLIIFQTYTGSANGNNLSMMIHPWLVIFQSFTFIILASFLSKNNKLYQTNKRLAKVSFFIYALHPFILGYVGSIINKIMPMPDTWFVKTFNYLSVPLVCVAICIIIYYSMQKAVPSALGVMVGERKK